MPRKRIPIEKNLWSEKSKAGLDYVFAPGAYEDKRFICRACGKKSVFTAEQQKYTYEVKKAYTWEEHVLCSICFKRRHELLAESKALAAAWQDNKVAFKRNRALVQRWKEVLEILPTYGIRQDAARIRMLTKLLQA